MRLPEKADRRREASVELARQCSGDRQERKAYHMELRGWMTRGTDTGDQARYNKIRSHVRQSAAYLYQSESVRFGPVLPPLYGDTFDQKLDVYRDEVHRWWHDSRATLTAATGVRWGHVYPTIVWKVVPSAGQPHVSLVPDPADIGVLEPDRPFDRQEAKIHFYWLTLSKFRRLVAGHPHERELLKLAISEAETGGDDDISGATLERIAFDNSGSPMDGGGVPVAGAYEPTAHVEAPRVLMAELWVVDDRLGDWRVFTSIAPGGVPAYTILDRRNPVLAGIDPFVSLTLDDAPDYTWGFSELADLVPLQQERDEYKGKMLRLLDLQLDPPMVLGGFGGLKDDRAQRLRRPGGVLATSIPNPTVHRLAPTMPPEMFGTLAGIDQEFADAGGLPILFQAQQGADGVRAGNQVGALATLASARIRENAMRVEYAISELATLGALMLRQLSDDPLTLPDGARFLMSQIPREVLFLVASHSASPLYEAAGGDKADRLLKAGAIGRPTYVELVNPPMVDVLRREARKLEAAAAKRQEQMLEIAKMKAERGRSR